MKKFMDKDFLLRTKTAKDLYHNAASDMPIYDFHNHLDAKEIYDDIQFENVTQVWLSGDHYKWRQMRTNGYTHEQIVGPETTDIEKFQMWADTVENLFGNPLYHWTHLELQRYFDIYEPLKLSNAKEIYCKCNEILNTPEFSVRNLLRKMNVYALCTTNDPAEDLKYHKLLAEDKSLGFKVLPTFRPDKAFKIQLNGYKEYINTLSDVSGVNIKSYNDLLTVLEQRLAFFVDCGCKITDHALDIIYFAECDDAEADNIFKNRLNGKDLSLDEIKKFQGNLLTKFGQMYNSRNLVMQLHIGAYRDSNSLMFEKYGPDTGFDCIEDKQVTAPLVSLLDSMANTNQLPKTVLYTLNSKDNDVLPALAGCYQDGSVKGKIQVGSAWWFQDHIMGMESQMENLAALGMLSTFIGMLTDSRSFLSYPRHEYFRRVLCNMIGDKVENGEFPNDIDYLKNMVKNISFNNAKEFIEG